MNKMEILEKLTGRTITYVEYFTLHEGGGINSPLCKDDTTGEGILLILDDGTRVNLGVDYCEQIFLINVNGV